MGWVLGEPPADRRPHAGAPVLRAAADRDRARAGDPAGVAGQPDPRRPHGHDQRLRAALHDPVARAVRAAPAAAGHAHPGPDQRDRRADRLHRRAARPHGRGRAERRPPGGRQLGDRDGVRPAAPVRRRRAAAVGPGRRGRPSRGRGVEHQPRHGRCGDRVRRPGQDVHRRVPARDPGGDRHRHRAGAAARPDRRRAAPAARPGPHPVGPGGPAPPGGARERLLLPARPRALDGAAGHPGPAPRAPRLRRC